MRFALFLFVTLLGSALAWDEDDMEVFDVVEEVNQNFYELLGVAQDASPAEVKSAFKKLTLKLHPDKNDSPDADMQFRNLVSVHNILKDPGKREKYNEVLKNGLPNWRSAVYYYRHVRKMGLAEGSIILFIIITFGQYAVGWAAYAEKRFTAEQILNSRGKKHLKKSGFDAGLAEILEQLPKPSIKDTLPFQIPRFIWWSIFAIPRTIMEVKRQMKEKEEEEKRQKKKEEEERARAKREALAAEARGPAVRRRRGFEPPERDHCLLDAVEAPDDGPVLVPIRPAAPPVISGGLWTDDDLTELVRLVKKYPGGAGERWERIAHLAAKLKENCYKVPGQDEPPPQELPKKAPPVISGGLWTDDDLAELVRLVKKYPGGAGERWERIAHLAAKLKENCYKVPGQDEPPPQELPKKVKSRKPEQADGGVWSQPQQRALEAALARHPKGGVGDRWQKIAANVPDKTKEECMQRCKYLSDLVKKQKQQAEVEKETENETANHNEEAQAHSDAAASA